MLSSIKNHPTNEWCFGERFETYCIPGPRGSGEIALNGAAAHKGKVGDLLVIITFVSLNPEEASVWEPKLVLVEEKNLSHQIVISGVTNSS